MSKYRAVEWYFPHGRKAQVWSEYYSQWCDILTSPVFQRPESAIRWAMDEYENTRVG